MLSRPDMEAAIRKACYRAGLCGPRELDGGSMELFNPSLEALLFTLAWHGIKWECLPGKNVSELALWGGDDGTFGKWFLRRSLSEQQDETVADIYQILSKNNAI